MSAISNPHGARRLDPVVSRSFMSFTFDGQSVTGFAGEPVAVALLAAGVRVFRTMPESGEPRGGFCFVGRCADCLMTIDGQPGVRSCITPLREGMTVQTQRGHGDPAEPAR
jgi:predicted molibdopterin-dependent oxidoreductase YjgC